MIGEGIVKLVQDDADVVAIAAIADSGFMLQLPKDLTRPAWTWRSAGQTSDTTLTTARGLNMLRLQIDCFAADRATVIRLAAAIDAVLDGFAGNLLDDDATFVSSCFNTDMIDFFEDAPRSFRRMLEYEVLYSQD